MTIEDFNTGKDILGEIKNLKEQMDLITDQIIKSKKDLETFDAFGKPQIPASQKVLYMSKACAPDYVVVNMDEWMELLEIVSERLTHDIDNLNEEFARLGE